MIRSFVRWVVRWTVRSAVVAGIGTLIARLLRQEPTEPTGAGVTASAPASPETPPSARSTDKDEATAWVAPVEGACPTTHPVKLKEASGIYHLPGGLTYDRTVPDRCYRDGASAEADGFRQAKR